MLAVAFQYTLGNQTYQVGELTLDGLMPKFFDSKTNQRTAFSPNLPNWDLMMKIYIFRSISNEC